MIEIKLSAVDAKQAILYEVFRQTGARLELKDVNIGFVGPEGSKEVHSVYIVKKQSKEEFQKRLKGENDEN
jgi:hypothetical protein